MMTINSALLFRLLMMGTLPDGELRDLEPFAIFARQEPIGVFVADERLLLAIEHERAADAIRDVRQVRQRRREMAFEDVARQDLRIASADRVDEVLVVWILRRRQPGRLSAFTRRQICARAFFVLRPEVRLPRLAGFCITRSRIFWRFLSGQGTCQVLNPPATYSKCQSSMSDLQRTRVRV